jgi:hypothetical protein
MSDTRAHRTVISTATAAPGRARRVSLAALAVYGLALAVGLFLLGLVLRYVDILPGPSLWIGWPLDWSHNIDFGWSGGHWFFMTNSL